MTEDNRVHDEPSREVRHGGTPRLRALAQPLTGPLDRRLDRIHEHLDDVARRLDRGDEDADLRQLLGEALDQLRAQSAATLQLARALQTFAELTATRLDAIAEEVDGTRRRAQGDS